MFDPYYLDMFLRVLAICLVLTGMHGYLGIHVLARQVIFVDLAMAQIAALGATYALFLGFDPTRHPEDAFTVYLFSLGLTLVGAAIFALTRARHGRIPQEAIIGIVYASASAIVILMLAKSPIAGEQIKHMLVGNILLVRWPTILETALIYSGIGIFHWLARTTFLRITEDPAGAERDGIRVRLWDFLFYGTFGVVITSSVAIGGVLLVFSFLVVPAAIGMLLADRTTPRIGVAWAAGTAVSVMGIIFSFLTDVPAGPAVVASFAALLVAAGLLRFVQQASSRSAAAAKVLAGALVLVGAAYGTSFLRKEQAVPEQRSELAVLVAALGSGEETEQLDALHHVAEDPDPRLARHVLRLVEETRSDRVMEHAVKVIPSLGDPKAVDVLARVAARDLDPFLRIEVAEAILRCRDPGGIPILADILETGESPIIRAAALSVLSEYTGRTFGYDADLDPEENALALDRWRSYWRDHGPHLRWRQRLHRFE